MLPLDASVESARQASAGLALVGGIGNGAGARLVTRWLIVSAIDQESDRLQAAMDGLKPPALRTRQKPLASQAIATACRNHKDLKEAFAIVQSLRL